MMREPHISSKKIEEVEKIAKLVEEYPIVGLVNLEKVPAKALHSMRDNLRGDVIIRMSKKRLVLKAFEKLNKPNLMELANEISGITALIFTKMNPIKLAQFLESKAVKGPAKAGDQAPTDIVVKAGDTKLAPGPIISELKTNLNAPTSIKNGTIHIITDTTTHKKGDYITEKQAQLLARLGIEPMTIKLDFYLAWENGELLPDEVLHLDEGKILNDVSLAASQALNLALSLGMVTEETLEPLLVKAEREALGLAMELPIIIPELIEKYFSKGILIARGVEAAALGLAPAAEESAPEPEPEPEPKKKEEEVGGLGSLFG